MVRTSKQDINGRDIPGKYFSYFDEIASKSSVRCAHGSSFFHEIKSFFPCTAYLIINILFESIMETVFLSGKNGTCCPETVGNDEGTRSRDALFAMNEYFFTCFLRTDNKLNDFAEKP